MAPPPHFTSGDRELVTELLTTASAMAYRKALQPELAEELVARAAMTVAIFPFLQMVLDATEIEMGADGYAGLPGNVKKALKHNQYSNAVAAAIDGMHSEDFNTLLVHLVTGEIERIQVRFSLPIITRLYRAQILTTDVLLAYMAINLREPIEERAASLLPSSLFSGGVFGTIGSDLLSLGLIGTVLSDICQRDCSSCPARDQCEDGEDDDESTDTPESAD